MQFEPFDLLKRVEEGHSHARYDLSSSDMPPQRLSVYGGIKDISLASSSVGGSQSLRSALAKRFGGKAEDYIVTAGASEANFAVAAALVAPGDPVLVETPTYQPLVSIPAGLGARVSRLELRESDGFRLAVEDVRRAMPPGLKLLVLSNLNNPTGAPLDASAARGAADLAAEQGFYLHVDETFRELAFEDEPPTVGGMNDRTIVTSTLSKFYGAGGLRIGWVRAAAPVRARVRAVLDYLSVNPAGMSDRVAVALLRQRAKTVSRNRRLIQEGRKIVAEWAEATPGVGYTEPVAHLAFPRVDADTADLSRRLLEKHDTFIAPGESFGLDRHFRLNLGRGRAQLVPGLARVARALRER